MLEHLLDDPCGLSFAAAVLYAVGNAATEGDNQPRRLSAAAAGVVLLVTFCLGIHEGQDLVGVAVSSVALGFLTIGAARIVVTLVSFVVAYFRPKPKEPLVLCQTSDFGLAVLVRSSAFRRSSAKTA